RRTAAALERHPRRHELRRAASRASVLRRPARRTDSVLPAAPRGQAGTDRLGAGEVPLWLFARRRDGEAAVRPVLHQAPVGDLRSDDRVRHRQGRALPERGGVTPAAGQAENYLDPKDHHLVTIARNVGTRYLAIAVELVIGLVMLPFN